MPDGKNSGGEGTGVKRLLIAAVGLSLGLAGASGGTLAQEAADVAEISEEPSATIADLVPEGTTEIMTAIDGDAATLGAGNASAAPGLVTRGGVGRAGTPPLGPDGTYSAIDTAPSNVSIAGDTEVLAPPAAPAAAPATTVAGCDSYASWYDAQVAYEAAGMTAADQALVAALDPDYDGIACEEGM
jgi:hypothetical protein